MAADMRPRLLGVDYRRAPRSGYRRKRVETGGKSALRY
ncbi:MAG: hypothetical protein ACI8U4_001501, partial [Natronomonas sp.]